MNKVYKPIVLLVLDGWGLSPAWGGNPITMNNPTNMTRLWREYPHKVLQAFALIAGKYGVVGDSRLGHSTLSAGRRLVQDYERISQAIADKSFYKNQVLKDAFNHCQKNNSNLHLIGLLSDGGIHAHISHLNALLDMASRENFDRVFIDAISDGVDNGANDAVNFVSEIEQKFLRLNLGRFSSISGRYYAMDRDGDYKKTLKVYEALILGKAAQAKDPIAVLTSAYRQKSTDFTISPTLVGPDKKALIGENDAIVFFNFRSDRAIQLVRVLSDPKFRIRFFKPKLPKNLYVATLTEYQKDLPVKVAFEREKVSEILPAVLAKYQKNQLRVAETEKQAHVTSFFNCGEASYEGEDEKIILSKKVKDWSELPEMSTKDVTDTIISAIKGKKYDFILANLANVDMMAHAGNITAAGKAVKVVDEAVGKIVQANLDEGGATIITADHGNVEQIVKFNPNQDPENKHTLNPVPFILVTPENRKNIVTAEILPSSAALSKLINIQVSLADVAPTILELMDLPKPEQMKGHSILGVLE